ncbi:glycoside hydrolase family 16 protein [Malassezia restricta]|uniref:Uncharacterized protein n=1 Tax=Malassezia restricta (strain ATCC 96810 / NBRC 103918 / CBS 7877) TaxID=425264 RepID=A0A3G2SB22_MALR7|nr:glycoside hydrolase family 16 protein [Malassezia restricta]AXA52072.1 glycoside hydrolase family 16 protein [Malassezia restricta]AYO44622.1 uncharacterized protein DNF11_3672 [Malassezia restricta CBS 7877]
MKLLLISLVQLLWISLVSCVGWKLDDSIVGEDYFNKFNFYAGPDGAENMTHGMVQYVDMPNAKRLNLSYANGDSFVMRVDTTMKQPNGRPSVRLHSKKTYEDSVIVLQVAHVPTGCAVWPAFWTVTENRPLWPKGGEIDMLENANDQYPYNLAAVHVNTSCAVTNPEQTGTTVFDQCNAYANDSSGCRIAMNGTDAGATWGHKLNEKGGGTVAMQRDFSEGGKGIRMWFWENCMEPSELKKPGESVDPDSWGTPAADFGLTQCADQFDNHNIIFDITLCGDWAEETYTETSCPSNYKSCGYQVGNLGNTFENAFWDVKGLYIYTPDASGSSSSKSKRSSKDDKTCAIKNMPSSAMSHSPSALLLLVTLFFSIFL